MSVRRTRDWKSIKEIPQNSFLCTSGCHTFIAPNAGDLSVFLFLRRQAPGRRGNFSCVGCTDTSVPESIWSESLFSGGFRGLSWLSTCLSSNSGGSKGPFLLLQQLIQLSVPTASKSTNGLGQPMALFGHWEYSFVLTSYFIYCNKVTTHITAAISVMVNPDASTV